MKKRYTAKEKQGGFTLVEISLVLIISGLVTTILFDALRYKVTQDNRQSTTAAMDSLETAYTEFVATYGRYPCPARLGLAPGNVNYGVEDCVNTNLATATEGQNGNAPDNVLIGDIPVKSMAPLLPYAVLRDVSTLDGRGNRIQYAVTQSLTVKATYNPSHGAINVVDENQQSVLNAPNSAHMVLISFGDDGRGGYAASGAPTAQPCGNALAAGVPPPGQTPENELENCDNNNSTFLDGLRNLSIWSYNDDIVRFYTYQVSGLWNITGTYPLGSIAGTPGTYNQVVNANNGLVGVGTDTPTTTMDVAGSLAAAQVQSPKFCDQTGANCLLAAKLGGNDPLMSCGANQAIDYISYNPAALPGNPALGGGDIVVHCRTVFAGPVAATCPAGQYINAVSNLGNVKCTPYGGACNNSTAGACVTGTPGGFSDNGTTSTWTCSGTNGGPPSSCSMADAPAATNGACNNSTAGACTAGTAGATSDSGGTTTWTCNGSNGGTNASCSMADGGGGGGGSGGQPCACVTCPTVGKCGGPFNGENVYCNGQFRFQCMSYSYDLYGTTNDDGSCNCSGVDASQCWGGECTGY